jgi:hypothetical protein
MTEQALIPTVGRMVHFFPKNEERHPGGIVFYASIVTQVNGDLTLDLATFGPNSLYFQHNVPMFGQKFDATDEHPAGSFAFAWGWSWPNISTSKP